MKKIIVSLSVVAIVAVVAVGATRAYFSDSATSTGNTFTAGILSIDDSGLTSAIALTIPYMAPGDITNEYNIIIKNNGNLNLAWLGDWQFSGGANGTTDLKDALYIEYAKMEFLSPNNTDWNSDTTEGYESNGADVFIQNGTGHGPYPAAYAALVGGPLNVLSLNRWNNNSTMVTTGTYEHAGALKPGYAYKLTVKFGFAPTAGNAYQGLGPVTATFKVDATQLVASQITALTGGWADMTWLNNQIADQTE